MQITCASTLSKVYPIIFMGSDIAMNANDNLISGIYESIALGDNDLVTIPPTNTTTIAGDWSGTTVGIGDSSFSTQIDLSVQKNCSVGEKCGTVYAPQEDCSGDIVLESIIGNTFSFVEQNMTGSPSCVSGGREYIRLAPDGTLSWSFFYVDLSEGQAGASATLTKK
jgi:hypothetical protein